MILELLKGPVTPETSEQRGEAVLQLRSMLGGPASLFSGSRETAATADYVHLAVSRMTAAELVVAADWEALARSPAAIPWLYPGNCRRPSLSFCILALLFLGFFVCILIVSLLAFI